MKIVTESSACLSGYPRTLLDADHSGMCKFQDKTDVNYVRVSGLLARWTEELAKPLVVAKEQTVHVHPNPVVWLCKYRCTNRPKVTHSSNTTFSGNDNSGFQLGHNAGNLSGFTFGRK